MSTDNQKKEFHETLAAVVEYATVSGNQISKETIHTYFGNLIQDESMYEFIYKYLSDAKITVEGYEAPAGASTTTDKNATSGDADTDSADEATSTPDISREAKDSPEASAFFEMYLADLQNLEQKDDTVTGMLLSDLLAGKPVAGQLTEQYLPMVLQLTEKFEHRGLAHSDLVAEGNLALYEAILDYQEISVTFTSLKDFENHLATAIVRALKNATDEEISSYRVSSHLADQVNALNDAATELAKDLGREATLEELCKHLSMGEEEVKELMRVSIQALTVVEPE